jgi:4-aminobutyrate aminotransferase
MSAIQKATVANVHLKTELPGPKARAMIARDASVSSPSYPRDYPFVMSHGAEPKSGTSTAIAFLISRPASRLLDGHAIRRWRGRRRLDSRTRAITGTSGDGARAARRARADARTGDELLSGTGWSKRRWLARTRDPDHRFLGGFHGRTMGSLSFTSSKYTQQAGFAPTMPGVMHVPYPNVYRPLFAGPDQGEAVLSYIRMLFERNLPPQEVAAILVEPLQGEGGYLVPPAGFLAGLRSICDEHGIFLIFDEVQCGVGRTGQPFAAEHDGVAPDIMTLKGPGPGCR